MIKKNFDIYNYIYIIELFDGINSLISYNKFIKDDENIFNTLIKNFDRKKMLNADLILIKLNNNNYKIYKDDHGLINKKSITISPSDIAKLLLLDKIYV